VANTAPFPSAFYNTLNRDEQEQKFSYLNVHNSYQGQLWK